MRAEVIAALKDGADALRYRAEKLREHSAYEDSKPFSQMQAEMFERHAAILERMIKP
jgi:hypothetical protein